MRSFASAVLLFAALTTAAPFTNQTSVCNNLRTLSPLRTTRHRTTDPQRVNSTGLDDRIEFGATNQVQYSSNWAGAVQIGEGITEVSGQVTFPRVTSPAGAVSGESYGGSVWVGIDGDTCPQSILQTGIDWVVQGNTATYAAWYEWLPDASYDFDIVVNPGDQIVMKVVADNTTSGTASISNLSTNVTVSHSFTGQNPLCMQNAEWIVEDFSVNSGLIPFAAFDTITVTDASYVANGTTAGVNGSTIMDIQQNGAALTNCDTAGESKVVCTYEGAGAESRFM